MELDHDKWDRVICRKFNFRVIIIYMKNIFIIISLLFIFVISPNLFAQNSNYYSDISSVTPEQYVKMYYSGETIPSDISINVKSDYSLESEIPDITESVFENFAYEICDNLYAFDFVTSSSGERKLDTPLKILPLKNCPSKIYILKGTVGSGHFETMLFLSKNQATDSWETVFTEDLGSQFGGNYTDVSFFVINNVTYLIEASTFEVKIYKLGFDKYDYNITTDQIGYFKRKANITLTSEQKKIVTRDAVLKFLYDETDLIDQDYQDSKAIIKTDYGILNGSCIAGGHVTGYINVMTLESLTTNSGRTVPIKNGKSLNFSKCVYFDYNGPKLLLDKFWESDGKKIPYFDVLDLRTMEIKNIGSVSASFEFVLSKENNSDL